MSSQPQVEDDDLAMYALGSLEPDEASAVSRAVAESSELFDRLNLVQEVLGLFGEASINLVPAPQGSFDRLRNRLNGHDDPLAESSGTPGNGPFSQGDAQQTPIPFQAGTPVTSVPVPGALAQAASGVPNVSVVTGQGRSPVAQAMAWIGWAIAAVLLITAGKLYHDRATLHATIATQAADNARLATQADELQGQRDTLALGAAEESRRVAELSQRTASANNDKAVLQSAIASRNEQLASRNEELASQSSQIASQNDQIASKNSLIAAKNSQVAQLSSDAETAHEILVALTGTSALRLPLTKPKSHAAPLAQAAYVANQRTLVFLASNLAPLKANKVYQLWLMPANGSSPVPAGTFSPDARGQASLFYTAFPSAIPAVGFSVTIENAGGSQKPTLPIVLASAA